MYGMLLKEPVSEMTLLRKSEYDRQRYDILSSEMYEPLKTWPK